MQPQSGPASGTLGGDARVHARGGAASAIGAGDWSFARQPLVEKRQQDVTPPRAAAVPAPAEDRVEAQMRQIKQQLRDQRRL